MNSICCCGLDRREQGSLPEDLKGEQILKFDYMSQVISWFDSYVKHSLPKKITVVSRNFTERQLKYLFRNGIEIVQVRDNIYEDGLVHFYRYEKGGFIEY